MNAKDKLVKARFSLVRSGNAHDAYYGHILLHLKMTEDDTIKGKEMGWTDGISLGYNPKQVMESSLDQVKGFLVHEADHVQAGHHFRMIGKDHDLWNQATDYVINGAEQKYGRTLYEGALIDRARFDGKTAEEVYSMLRSDQQNQQQKPQDDQQQGGQGQDNKPQPGTGDVRPFPGKDGQQPTQAEMREAEQHMKQVMAQAKAAAKKAGTMDGGFEKDIDKIIDPPISVTDYLRRFMEDWARDDYTWRQPNPRYIPHGLYLPSLKSPELSGIVFVLDTSGSMWTGPELAECESVLEDAMMMYNTTVTVIHADRSVKHVEEFSQADLPLSLKPRGGGRTDFRPAFDYVGDHDLNPKCLVYFTDCEGRFPDSEPDYPVLWIKMGQDTPPWGDWLEIPR